MLSLRDMLLHLEKVYVCSVDGYHESSSDWLAVVRPLSLLCKDISCTCFQELQQSVEEFQREAKASLNGANMPSTAKLKQLIDQGQNLGVDLSECKPLKLVTSLNHAYCNLVLTDINTFPFHHKILNYDVHLS